MLADTSLNLLKPLDFYNVEFIQPYVVNLIYAADFSKVQQSFAHSMKNFKFEIIGETQTEEEIMIGNFNLITNTQIIIINNTNM